MEEKYDPLTGALLSTQKYLGMGYKYDPTTGLKLDAGDGGLFSTLSTNDMIDGIGGIGQLGLGLMNYFENKKFNKARIAGLQENIAASRYARERHRAVSTHNDRAFNPGS